MNRFFLLLIFISSIGFSQQLQSVDFKKVNAKITIDTTSRKVSGNATFDFEIHRLTDTVRIDAIDMDFANVKINGKPVKFRSTGKQLQLFEGYKKGKNKVTFSYEAQPKQTMYFTGKGDTYQIWTQGQGKNTSHWLPSFDDVNEKLVFEVSVMFDKSFSVLSNGTLKKKSIGENVTSWEYRMKQPMSSYLVMMAIGKFDKKTSKSASGIPLEMYYQKGDESKADWTYKYTKAIFDYLEDEIGVKYPWEIYRQVPVRDFLYAGMENTTSTVFAQDFVVDEIGYNDRSYINVNAHELAHQWFGDLVTAKSGQHHWLQEGFATYYALLAERKRFGEDHFNYQLYGMAVDLRDAAKAGDTVPVLNERASSLTFYRKGAWALHVLREEIGAKNFDAAIKSYLRKHSFKNVITEDFLSEMRNVSGYDTKPFEERWLKKGGFLFDESIAVLRKNPFMNRLLEVRAMTQLPFEEKQDEFLKLLKSDAFHPIKEEIVYQISEIPMSYKADLITAALATNDVHVRQAVARTMGGIPDDSYHVFEPLLNDPSYITREIALNMLYGQFVDRRFEILDKTDGMIGLNDKNLRMLWLTLALSTDSYRDDQKVHYYDELIGYTSAVHEATVRQNALEKLFYLNPDDTNVLKAIIPALTHHRWQFSRFARDKIRELIKEDKYRNFYMKQVPLLNEKEQFQLHRLLSEKQS